MVEHNREWMKERHEIIKKELYPFADIPGYEMKAKIDVFKIEHPELVLSEKPEFPHISMYQVLKYIQQFF
ncbi:hypothetical protein LCGC14_0531290 [marine sediment metagenome]|uniref:Uncharacterized protein n=1 Tax=marine sediment metagenome TaxID=412755 RepID=A0A0F9V3L2_9ZZZZ